MTLKLHIAAHQGSVCAEQERYSLNGFDERDIVQRDMEREPKKSTPKGILDCSARQTTLD